MSRWTLAYWLWRCTFEWRFRVSRKIARHFNREAYKRGVRRAGR